MLSRTACKPSAFLVPFLPSARNSAARFFIAARSSALKLPDSVLAFVAGILRLPGVDDLPAIAARRDSVLRSLYLLFNEGYHGSSPQDPVRPFLCEDGLRLTELLLDAKATAHPDVHALAALFCRARPDG